MTSGAANDLPRIPELEADYEFLRELGRGGTAIVYLARDLELDRLVAIKFIRPSFLHDEEAVARLLREARTVGGLQHPNIVTLLGTRRVGERELALILEFVPGRTLRERLHEVGALPVSEAQGILRDLAGALSYAHRRRIVHRDIKPENVYVDDEAGMARLADFGIARAWDGDSDLTLPGTALGTPTYMSPEQVDGGQVDGRSDLYSLGLIGWEMLSGQRPWEGESIYEVIYKQKHEELPRLEVLRPDAPRGLLQSIQVALAKDPEQRWRNAGEFLEAMAHGPGTSPGRSTPSPVEGEPRRRAAPSLPEPIGPERAVSWTPDASSIRYRRSQRRARRVGGSWLALFLVLLLAGVGTAAVVEGPGGPIRSALDPVRSLLTQIDLPDAIGGASDEASRSPIRDTPAPGAVGGTGSAAPTESAAAAGFDSMDVPTEGSVTDEGESASSAAGPEDDSLTEPSEGSVADPVPPALPARLEVMPGTGREGIAGRELDAPVAVRVTDVDGGSLPGQWIRFVVSGEGAAVGPDSALTDTQGVARTTWTLGRAEGPQEMVARVIGDESLSTRVTVDARVPVLATRAEVVAGGTHTCRLQLGGDLACWGGNGRGQVGDSGGGLSGSMPRIAETTFARVTTGLAHTCVLTTGRVAYCWGANERGQLGDGSTVRSTAPTPVARSFRFDEIQAGAHHTCGLTTAGRILCWGANDHGQVGDGTLQTRTAPTRVSSGVAFRTLAVGWNHTCALDVEGFAHCWGANTAGELGSPAEAAVATPIRVAGGVRFRSLSAGSAHTCALTPDGAAYCWGENEAGQLGDGSNEARIGPARVLAPEPFNSVVAGAMHSCGLGESGRAYCWGRNLYGQVGDGSTTDRHEPVEVEGAFRFHRLDTFGSHTCGPSTVGDILCWGYNADGQLGDGTRGHRHTPVPVSEGE